MSWAALAAASWDVAEFLALVPGFVPAERLEALRAAREPQARVLGPGADLALASTRLFDLSISRQLWLYRMATRFDSG